MTGEQAQAPDTPRDGDDIGIAIESPKVVFFLIESCSMHGSVLYLNFC